MFNTLILLERSNGHLAENYTEVAKCWAEYFNSVFIDEDIPDFWSLDIKMLK